MATRNLAIGGGTNNNQIDLLDVFGITFLPVTRTLMLGDFSWSINVFGSYDFNQALIHVSAATVYVSAGADHPRE